jgi:GNAT superfamily N-acetyltransferase
MTGVPAISAARSAKDLRDVATLFADYAAWLPIDLGYQGFAAELAGLPGSYAPPRGELLLARSADGVALGCVGLRPLAEEGCCEMKRLFLTPQARGLGLGRALAEAIVGEARRIGYSDMRLDTLASMRDAIGLYERIGFVEIPAYYAPTPDDTLFMSLRL